MTDPFEGESSLTPSQETVAHRAGYAALQSHSQETLGTTRVGNVPRRGNSDGGVLVESPGRQVQQPLRDGETWMDFLRYSGLGRDQREQAHLATRRGAIMAADRNRRFAAYPEENTRRRSSSNITFPTGRSRPGLPHANFASPPSILRTGNDVHGERIVDRPLPRRPSMSVTYGRRQGQEIVLPRWQPDSEVTKCPICNTAFGFWYRKHHCRKCGRVVCANCSPHRITIPRQFTVHPPGNSPSTTQPRIHGIDVVDLTGNDEASPSASHSPVETGRDGIDPALGGGQEVRLCNPCVPDPNPLPHLHHASPRYALDSFPRPDPIPRLSSSQVPPRTSSYQRPLPPPPRRESLGRQSHHSRVVPNPDSRSGVLDNDSSIASGFSLHRQRSRGSQSSTVSDQTLNHPPVYGSVPEPSPQNRNLAALLNERMSTSHRHRHHASTGHIPDEVRHRFAVDGGVASSSYQRPQPELREEDECPICHSALPPKGPDGSETRREQHVTECIESHFSSSGPRTVHPHPSVATVAAARASAATPPQAGATAGPSVGTNAQSPGSGPSPSFMPRRRTTGMVVYHASEKDCIGEDGEGAQECVICFEEFAVGDEMGRLECLCKFHKMCIRQWWDTKGAGSCPVHQGGL